MKTFMVELIATGYYYIYFMEAKSGEIGECVKATYGRRCDLYNLGFKDIHATYTEVVK